MVNDIVFFGEPKQWKGSGKFTPEMMNFSDLSQWLNRVTFEFQNVISKYQTAIKNDGIIDIIEKKQILKEYDEFFNCLIALRLHLLHGIVQYEVNDDSFGFAYTIKKLKSGWEGEGIFQKQYKLHMDRFEQWYQNIMLKKFDHFASSYRDSIKDGVIDETEKEELYDVIDYFIFELLLVREFLRSGVWKT